MSTLGNIFRAGAQGTRGFFGLASKVLVKRMTILIIFILLITASAIMEGIQQKSFSTAIKGISKILLAADNTIIDRIDKLRSLPEIKAWNYIIPFLTIFAALFIYAAWYIIIRGAAKTFFSDSIAEFGVLLLFISAMFILKILSNVIDQGMITIDNVFTIENIPLYGIYYLAINYDIWLSQATRLAEIQLNINDSEEVVEKIVNKTTPYINKTVMVDLT